MKIWSGLSDILAVMSRQTKICLQLPFRPKTGILKLMHIIPSTFIKIQLTAKEKFVADSRSRGPPVAVDTVSLNVMSRKKLTKVYLTALESCQTAALNMAMNPHLHLKATLPSSDNWVQNMIWWPSGLQDKSAPNSHWWQAFHFPLPWIPPVLLATRVCVCVFFLLAVRTGSAILPPFSRCFESSWPLPCLHSSLPPSLPDPSFLLTRRPRSCFVPGPRPAVGEGEPDGEDGGVGVVCYPWGSHVGRGSDCHGVGPWCVAATVLISQWRTETGTQTRAALQTDKLELS